MRGIVVQFRRGRHRIHEKQYLIDLGLKTRDEAKKMSGKEIEWKSPGNKIIKGKISDAHGNSGLVRAIFEKGLPGQAMATEIDIKSELPKVEEKKDRVEKPTEKKEVKKEEKKVVKEIKEERDEDEEDEDESS